MRHPPLRLACLSVLTASLVARCAAMPAQPFWAQFRGPNGQGVAESAHPPVKFSPTENLLWSVELPPGHSSPCIWGDKIFLSAIESDALQCRAYDRRTGKLLWTRPAPATKIERTHPFSNPAASTPAATENQVVFYFGSYGLICLTHEGKELWKKELAPPVSRGNYGSSASPIIFSNLVVQILDTDRGGSRLLAYHISTGESAWETPRPFHQASWSTPAVWNGDNAPAIVVLGSRKLVAYEPLKGTEVWSADGFPVETVPSIAMGDGLVFACSAGIAGRWDPEFEGAKWADLQELDKNHDGKLQKSEIPTDYKMVQRPELPKDHPGRLFPFPLINFFDQVDQNKDGELTEDEWTKTMATFFNRMDTPTVMALAPGEKTGNSAKVAWKRTRGVPEIPTPLYYEHRLFIVRDGGLLQCLEAASGKVIYEDRVGEGGGYAASPVAADGRVYLGSQSGKVVVVDARANELKVLARNALGERITATPALVENVIYVRTDRRLFAFGQKESASTKR